MIAPQKDLSLLLFLLFVETRNHFFSSFSDKNWSTSNCTSFMRTLYHSDIYVSFGEGVFHLERVASIKFNWLLYEIRLALFERIAAARREF